MNDEMRECREGMNGKMRIVNNLYILYYNIMMPYNICLAIDPKMCNLWEIIGFFVKIQLYLNLYALKMTV